MDGQRVKQKREKYRFKKNAERKCAPNIKDSDI